MDIQQLYKYAIELEKKLEISGAHEFSAQIKSVFDHDDGEVPPSIWTKNLKKVVVAIYRSEVNAKYSDELMTLIAALEKVNSKKDMMQMLGVFVVGIVFGYSLCLKFGT